MGARPAGSSERTEVSRSPKTVIATVRGIGVAVMTRTWGGVPALSVRAARCSTPKRCCSSTTTRPRSASSTDCSSKACVPITIPASPDDICWSTLSRAVLPIEPVSNTTDVPSTAPPSMPPCARSPSMALMERWCCCASTSVGARRTAWPPESTTRSIARSATRVLPEPTSPCRRRFIGWSRASSSSTRSPISRWPAVSSKGSRASKASSSPPPPARDRAPRARCAARRRARTSWRTRASSKRKRRCAAPTWA